jgi:hypothetical protein
LRSFHFDVSKVSPVPNDIRETSHRTFPYGGGTFFRPSDITDRGEMRFNDQGVPDSVDQLSPKEQMLALGYRFKAPWLSGATTIIVPLMATENAILRAYKATGSVPDGPFATSFVSSVVGPHIEDLMTISPAQREQVLMNITSPITGKILDFTCKNFSPGNAYIEMITDPVLRAEVNKRLAIKAQEADTMFYVRAYGEKGVILETVDVLRATPPVNLPK